jgi:hypothetical protein
MKSALQYLLIAASLSIIASASFAQVVINEYSASNFKVFGDNYGECHDWIELYNAGSSPVDLSGYFLADDISNIRKWKIPTGTKIETNGFLLFWASGRDEKKDGNFHTNFGLNQTSKKKECIILADASGKIIDSLQLNISTQEGNSLGRTTDGDSTWSVFIYPTPYDANNSSVPFKRYAERPAAGTKAGFYNTPQRITLSSPEPNASIHYTLDGTEPTENSPVYYGPLSIDKTTVLKAVTLSNDPAVLRSFTLFNTYFINTRHSLPVVSIAGDKLDSLANGNGSLSPVSSFEYFDTTGGRKAKTYGTFKKHGQDSWANSQRSLDFVSRDQMGYNKYIREKLFATTPRDEFQNVILRAAGDDNYPADHHDANAGSAHIRDAYVQGLADIGCLHLDTRRFAKCIVYINGQYWGIYDLRENPDKDDFCEYYYGQDKYHLRYLVYWGDRAVKYGGDEAAADWDSLYNFIIKHDLSLAKNYKYVTDRLDVESLTDYMLVNMFTVCSDWLNWNGGLWRGTDPTGGHQKWGFILWDEDATFDHFINYTGIPNTKSDALPCDIDNLDSNADPRGFIRLLMSLRKNPEFEQYYFNRMFDLTNTVFSREHMLHVLDSMIASIDPEMDRQAKRWGGTYAAWKTNVDTLRNYIIRRCDFMTKGISECYDFGVPYQLEIDADPADSVKVKLNTITISKFPWKGLYYKDFSLDLYAIPPKGFSFRNWSSDDMIFDPGNTSPNISFHLGRNTKVLVHFNKMADH